jgi:hypothetical protein
LTVVKRVSAAAVSVVAAAAVVVVEVECRRGPTEAGVEGD